MSSGPTKVVKFQCRYKR